MLDKIDSFKKETERFTTRWKVEVAGDKEEKKKRTGRCSRDKSKAGSRLRALKASSLSQRRKTLLRVSWEKVCVPSKEAPPGPLELRTTKLLPGD